jgi:hypothetical protein
MYNEDYLHAIGEKFRPKPDNLKLLLVAGAAFLSAVVFTALLTAFYWNGEWHLKTPAGENISHSESHVKDDKTETHKDVPAAEKPAESH